MRDGVEIFGQIGVDDVRVAPADQPVRCLDGVERASFGPVSIGAIFQVRLEDRPRVKMLWGLAAARLVILKVVQHLSRSIQ